MKKGLLFLLISVSLAASAGCARQWCWWNRGAQCSAPCDTSGPYEYGYSGYSGYSGIPGEYVSPGSGPVILPGPASTAP